MPIEFEPTTVRAAMSASLRQLSLSLDVISHTDMAALTTNFLAGGSAADTAVTEFASSLSEAAETIARNRQLVHTSRVLDPTKTKAAEKVLDAAYETIGNGAMKALTLKQEPFKTEPLGDLLNWMDGSGGVTAPAQARTGVGMVTDAIEAAGIEPPKAVAAAASEGDLATDAAEAAKQLVNDPDAI